VRGAIELDVDELRLIEDGVVTRQKWSDRPGVVLGDAVDGLLLETNRVFRGWVVFEFGSYRFGLQQRLLNSTPLARIFRPRRQFVVTADHVRLIDADDRHVEVLRRLLSEGAPNPADPSSADVRGHRGVSRSGGCGDQ
jgi:salicylate synthetase